MEFKPKDFRGLFVPVHEAGRQEMVKAYGLDVYPEFNAEIQTSLSRNKVIKYIVYMYDQNSPVQKLSSLWARKAAALELAGFSKEDGKFPNIAENMVAGKNAPVNKMIVRYCRMQNDEDWASLVDYEDAFAHQRQLLRDVEKKGAGREAQALIDNVDKLRGKIKSLKKTLLSGDDSRDLSDALYNEIENEELALRPEQIARKPINNRNPIRLSNEQID